MLAGILVIGGFLFVITVYGWFLKERKHYPKPKPQQISRSDPVLSSKEIKSNPEEGGAFVYRVPRTRKPKVQYNLDWLTAKDAKWLSKLMKKFKSSD